MDNLLADEERELSYLVAEHCRDMFSMSRGLTAPSAPSAVAAKDSATITATTAAASSSAPAVPSDTLAHSIVVVLAQTGWANLQDIHTALKEHHFSSASVSTNDQWSLTHDALRSEVKRLLFHNVLRYEPRTGRYGVNLLFASMRILFPLMLATSSSSGSSSGGVAAEAALHVLHEHHDLPLAVLSNMVGERLPGVGSTAVDRAIMNLQNDGWIVQVSATGGGGGAAAAAAAVSTTDIAKGKKEKAAAAGSSSSSSLVSSFGINYSRFLARYRSDVIVRYAGENLTRESRNVAQYLADRRKPEPQFQLSDSAESNPAPRLQSYGDEVNSGSMRAGSSGNKLLGGTPANLVGVVRGLAQDSGIVQITAAKEDSSVNARFNFETAKKLVYRNLICAEVRARFGHIGQRIIKILLEHRALEDKSIVEEGLIALTDLHEILLPMQKLGIITQQELLKTPPGGVNVAAQIAANSGPERNQKQSIFLWVVQERALLALVRRRICKSICALRMRLRSEWRESGIGGTAAEAAAASSVGSAGSPSGAGTIRQRNDGLGGGGPKRQNFIVGQAERQRFEQVQEHIAKALAALYEELALTIFF